MPLATINLPKSPTFLGSFCKGVKIFNFSSDIILGNFYRHLTFYWSHRSTTDKRKQQKGDELVEESSFDRLSSGQFYEDFTFVIYDW